MLKGTSICLHVHIWIGRDYDKVVDMLRGGGGEVYSNGIYLLLCMYIYIYIYCVVVQYMVHEALHASY